MFLLMPTASQDGRAVNLVHFKAHDLLWRNGDVHALAHIQVEGQLVSVTRHKVLTLLKMTKGMGV